jgi:hypothetical protein
MQADAFTGYNDLYEAKRKPAPILEAACWSHGRRKFFDLAKSGEAPIASEAVRRIDVLFEIKRSINGKTPERRLLVRLRLYVPGHRTDDHDCASHHSGQLFSWLGNPSYFHRNSLHATGPLTSDLHSPLGVRVRRSVYCF